MNSDKTTMSRHRYIGSAFSALFAAILLVGMSPSSSFAQIDIDGYNNNNDNDNIANQSKTTTTHNQTSAMTGQSNNNLTMTSSNEVIVGEGSNMTVSYNTFSPSSIEIGAGESVTFRADPGSTELHDVIFDLSGRSISDILLPFVPDKGHNHDYVLVPPFNVGQPIIQEQENGTKAIVAANKLAFAPSVVSQQNNVTYLINEEQLREQIGQAFEEAEAGSSSFSIPELSANYTINGTEMIVTSGILLDMSGYFGPQPPPQEGEGVVTHPDTETSSEMNQTSPQHDDYLVDNATTTTTPATATEEEHEEEGEGEHVEYPGPPFIPMSSFTVTFEEPGTYPYFCAFHPGMGGVVVVTDGEELTDTIGNQ